MINKCIHICMTIYSAVRKLNHFTLHFSNYLYLFQAQAGWLQHDFGHLSVFNSRKLNHIAHHLVIGHIKVSSTSRSIMFVRETRSTDCLEVRYLLGNSRLDQHSEVDFFSFFFLFLSFSFWGGGEEGGCGAWRDEGEVAF